jgi:hypothetical protein
MVETALTVGIGLTLLLFSVQVGMLGFLQITADAAAFVDAHANAVGTLDTLGAQHMAHAMFPQIATTDIASSPQPAPSVSFPLNYGFNTGGGTPHAGVSMMEPELYATTVTPHAVVHTFGKTLGVSGQAIEPLWLECGPHYNVAQSNSQCGAAGQPGSFAVNYFTQGENTPPYYAGFDFREGCALPQPWTSCPVNYLFIALGMGEFLNVRNWNAPNAGASGTGVSGTNPNSTFEWMACHQRAYSTLAAFFTSQANLNQVYSSYIYAIGNQVSGSPNGISNFRYWDEFNTSVTNFTTHPTPSAIDLTIQNIYAWDANVWTYTALNPAGEPVNTEATGQGC